MRLFNSKLNYSQYAKLIIEEHQKIVNHVEKWYYDLSGMTMRGNGWEHVRPSQSDIKRLLIRQIQDYQNKK